MNIGKQEKKSAEREIMLILIASMLLITVSSVLISAQGFVQVPYYFHWLDTPVDVGEVYNQSRVFNVTGPLLATAHEEVRNSDYLGLLGKDYDFYLTPELPADLNVSGVQTFSLWMKESIPNVGRDDVSAKTEILDFDPVTDAYVSLGISSAQHVAATDYTEYKYNISVESVVAKGHRIVARVHAFESIDNGGGPARNVDWSFAYDSNTYNSYVNLSVENVSLTVNLTEPYIEKFSSPESVFNITCNVSCDYGVCRNVTVYPQYCSGLSCTSFVNIDNETGGLVTSELSHFWSEVGDDEVLSYNFEITSNINNNYRVRCNATADNVFANLSDTSANVSVAELNMTHFDYENNNEYAILEYEVGDVIDWINVTVFADNNASFSNVSLNVLDSAGSPAGWGPDEKYECGLVENQSNCNATYTNNSNGYLISDAAGSGTYQWNVTYLWLGGFKENTSNSFSLHNLVQDNFTSAINFTKIAVGEAAEYNFTIENPWSKNLTSVNVTFNCPSVSGVECNCSLSGQQTQDYCYLGNVTSGVSDNALFYISTTSGTPLDAYDLNVTVSYVNPGSTSHTWTDVQNQEIDVMGAGILGWVYSSPLNFTRGSSFGLKGYVLNKNSTEETNVTLNWSLPAYWTNQTGNLNTSFDSISSGGINWSNITVSTTISAETGAQIAYIYANSSNLIGDSHYVTLDVFANSQLLEAQVNDSDPEHGDSIKITARLRYDNNTVVSNQNVSFIDHTYGVYRGSNLTDSSGYVYLYYTIPLMAPTGTHVLNITYDGNSSIYLNPKTVQVTADVHDYPQIVELYSSPSTVGYGYNVTVYANISDDDGADSVYLYVTDPRTGAEPYLTMGDVGGGMFSVNYTAWHYGEYEYYIWVNDSYDNQNQTDTQLQNFYVRSNITLRSVTDYSSYGLNTEVYINNSNWWNSSWNYRVRVDANSTSEETDVPLFHRFNFTDLLNYGGSFMHVFDINSIRVVEWNTTSETSTEIDSNKSYVDVGGFDLWDEDVDKPGPVDFSSGLNSTANTFGLLGPDDGWDWEEGTYGYTSDITSHADPDSLSDGLADGRVEVIIGGVDTGNAEYVDSGAWGIKFYVDDYMYSFIQNGAAANVSFDYTVENIGGLEEPSWVKARFSSSSGTTYLGYDCDGIDSDADSTYEVWCNVSYVEFSSFTSTFTEDVSSLITGSGWHYLDFGGKVDWRGYTKARSEGLGAYFDNISLIVSAVTYDNITNADLNVSWAMNGTTAINATRIYYIYFDDVENGEKQEPSYSPVSGSSANGTLTMTESAAEIKETKVQNVGNESAKFYLLSKIQYYNETDGWVDVESPIINYPATDQSMPLSADSIMYVNYNWTDEGGWNTELRAPGNYRLYTALMDDNFPSALILKDWNGNDLFSTYNFTIFAADVDLVNLMHDHQHLYGLNEYETGDNILWINLTYTSYIGSAPATNATLNILDESNSPAGFGPYETFNCGEIPLESYCYSNYTNSSDSYLIPTDATDGTKMTYTYKWNSTAVWLPAGSQDINTSNTFQLHHVPYGFSSSIAPWRLLDTASAIYNVTIDNPWSENLTSVNVTINCPSVSGMQCNCSLSGQETQNYCYLDNITSLANKTASFNISTSSTPVGDYSVTANVTYINPAIQGHVWNDQQNETFVVRYLYPEINMSYYPSTIIRNTTFVINGSVKNTGTVDSTNLWLNWTLPSANWTNVTGDVEVFVGTLTVNSTEWNNLTVNISIGEEPGPAILKLEAEDDFSMDWQTVSVDILAGTSIVLTSNTTALPEGDSVLLTAFVAYDNGTVLSGTNITFNDTTQLSVVGWNVSNNSGYATLVYDVPLDAIIGNHTINASYSGSSLAYLGSSYSLLNITVRDIPLITDVSASPSVTGYGQNVTLSANVTDAKGVDTVKVRITYPNSTSFWADMSNNTQDIFEYNFTDLQALGTYEFYIWANDTYNLTNSTVSDPQQFYVSVNATAFISPQNETYLPHSDVNLTINAPDWWNEMWLYRKFLNVTEPGVSDRVNWPVDAFVDTEGHADNCTLELRVVDSSLTEVPVQVYSESYSDGKCQSANFTFLSNVSNSSYSEYYVYYGNPVANAPSYSIWSDNCSSNSSQCANRYYSRQDLPAGLDNRTGEIMVLDADESYVLRPLPFDFAYFDDDFTTSDGVYVFDNGFFDLTNNAPDATPNETEFKSRKMVAAIWDDYDPTRPADGGAVYENELSNRIVWTWATATDDSGSDVVIQAVIYDTGDIMLRYGTVEGFQEAGHLAGISGGNSVNFFNNDHTDSSNTAFYQYYKAAGIFTAQNEETGGEGQNHTSAKMFNTGLTNITGKLLLEVRYYTDGVWETVDTVYDEVVTITAQSIFDLYSVWNPIAWNVGKNSEGLYSVYAAFTDMLGNVFKDDDGNNIEASSNFTVTWPVVLNFESISIYDVTDMANPKTNTSNFVDSGLNKTFSLYEGNIYRVEIAINNSADSTDEWVIDETVSVLFKNHNSSWVVNDSEEVWYKNQTDEFTDGLWDGNVSWNTSLGGVLGLSDNMTFYYILNVTSNMTGIYSVDFEINDTDFVIDEYSTYYVRVKEFDPPVIVDDIYSLNTSVINRGDSVLVYGQWNETIGSTFVEYNSTLASLVNYSLSPSGTWTNYSINTDSEWLIGSHHAKIYANDTFGNSNYTLPYLAFDVWGWSSILESDIALGDSLIYVGSSTLVLCRVTADDSTSVYGYNVSFYNSTSYIGYNITNVTGWAVYNYTDNTPGAEMLKCNITDDASKMFNSTLVNEQTIELITYEDVYPLWHEPSGLNVTGIVHKTDSVLAYANWTDNFELDYAWLSSNETGVWQNSSLISSLYLDKAVQNWSNFSFAIPVSMDPGHLSLKIYANDTSGNVNATDVMSLDVWGWASVSDSALDPSIMYNGSTTVFSCKVIDNSSALPVENYTVEFWNSTDFLGYNTTESDGWAHMSYTDDSLGTESLWCYIYDNETLQYNITSSDFDVKTLTTAIEESDITPPQAVLYDMNATYLEKGQSISIYALWDEPINVSNGSYVTYNSTSPSLVSSSTAVVSGNWTNHTFDVGYDWAVGDHVAKLNATDATGNWNDSLDFLTFSVYGYARIDWDYESTLDLVKGDNLVIECNVTDLDSSIPIDEYTVVFKNSTIDIGSNNSIENGMVTLTVNLTNYDVGSETFTCYIYDDDEDIFYYAADIPYDQSSQDINITANLTVSITNPPNNSIAIKDQTVSFKSATKDNVGDAVTPPTVEWYNDSLDLIGSTENITYSIGINTPVGPNTFKVNVSGEYYTSNESFLNLYVYGYSNISWVSSGYDSSYGPNVIEFNCSVNDNATDGSVYNHTVSFYVENATGSYLIGANETDGNGYAVIGWETSGYSVGTYYPKCNITDDADAYYYASLNDSSNSTIDLTETGTLVDVTLVTPPNGTMVGQNRTFVVNATIECAGSCGTVYGTVLSNGSEISSGSGTPFFTVGPNMKECSIDPLSDSETCYVNWTLNATGDLYSSHNISVKFNSSVTLDNFTVNSTVDIGMVVLLYLNFSEIDFGTLMPTDVDTPAVNNGDYGVFLDENSNDVDGVWVKGTNLTITPFTPATNCGPAQSCDNNRIPVWNITWSKTAVQDKDLQEYYVDLDGSTETVPSGWNTSMHFWLDLPPAKLAGVYNGTITFLANATY